MPTSRRRKPKQRKPIPAQRYGPKDPDAPILYKHLRAADGTEQRLPVRIGRLRTDLEACIGNATHTIATGGDTALAVAGLVATFTNYRMRNGYANICAQACIHLADVFALFGIPAVIVPVSVHITEPGGTASYFDPHPKWLGETVFGGHTIVYLPTEGRIIDLTVQQFDTLQHLKRPFIGRIGYVEGGHANDTILTPGTINGVIIEGHTVAYETAHGGEALIRDAPAAAGARDVNAHADASVAATVIDAARTLGLSGTLHERHARIQTLLDTVRDAPLEFDDGLARFVIDGRPTWLDELLPD